MLVKKWLEKLSVVGAYIGMVAVNALVNIVMTNGKGTGDIAHEVSVYFMPAGYTFSIWGVIYLAVLAFVIYQCSNRAPQGMLQHVRPWFILSCLANSIWIVFWQYDLLLYTVLEMIVLLVALIMIYQDIKRYLPQPTRLQWWCVKLPFSIYLAWVCVATIANITIALYLVGWHGFGLQPVIWSVIMMAVATLLGLIFLIRERDYIFNAVIGWSLLGIARNFPDQSLMVTTVAVALGLQALVALWVILHPQSRRAVASVL